MMTVAMLCVTSFAVPDQAAAKAKKKPAKVQSLKVSKVGYQSVTLKWSKTKRAKKYQIYRSENKDSGYVLIKTVKKGTRKYKDNGLTTGKKYWYYVRAVAKKKKGKPSKKVSGVPKLGKPKMKVTSAGDGVFVNVETVKGANGYIYYKDGKKLVQQREKFILDEDTVLGEKHEYSVKAYRDVPGKTVKSAMSDKKKGKRVSPSVKLEGVNNVKSPHYEGKSFSIKGEIVSNTTIRKVEIGVKNANEETGEPGDWVSDKVHYKKTIYKDGNTKKVDYLTFSIKKADDDVLFGTLPIGTYFYTINVVMLDGSEVEMKSQGFTVEEAPPEKPQVFPKETTQGAINAVKWAKKIAADNSFAYGKGDRAHHGGCYFCGTNITGPKKAKKGSKWEKTYCCNPFIFAAYAHGAKDPAILKACKKGQCGGMLTSDWTRYGCFAVVGKCKDVPYKDLLPGDVIISNKAVNNHYHHVIMECGNDQYVEAGWEGWGSSTIAVRSGSQNNYKKNYRKYKGCYVLRYTGK